MTTLRNWLQALGLEKYEEALRAHDIDLEVAPELTEQDLDRLGLSLGHRRKFIAAAAKLRAVAPRVSGGPAPADDPGAEAARVERRQVTVVFGDLVGSTALAGELDPEDMSRLLREYREVCAAVIRRYEGHVAQYLGDGILAYFGYPLAQEHAAERAIRAGLEIAAEVARLKSPGGGPLQSRVGIATGLVVSGGAGEGEQTVVGDTPNLAARLQSLAEPGAVLVSQSTHQLTADFIEYLFAGKHDVKGFQAPLPVWRALGVSAIESRFIAARAAVAGPIVGRERELTFLADAWQRAARGNGHAVLVSGEAGMGKSRLLEAIAERVRDQPHRLLRAQCSPYHANSVLYPFTQLLRNRLDLRRELAGAENLQRLDRMLARIGRATRQARLLMAELLELPVDEKLAPTEMTPAQRKNTTLEILEAFLVTPLDGATVLLLLEDAHWSDPSTQALIDRLLKRIGGEQALVVITHRPELKTAWAAHPQATLVQCKQLGSEHCVALARNVASQARIDDALVQEIASRSDGVPLYVEELTKAVLDMQSMGAGAVPRTLQDSLAARLDRLGGAKNVAQTASVIGRQFHFALLAAIAGVGEEELRANLSSLRDSGLIFAAGEEERTDYSFNHALVQEAAYESLSLARRQALHAVIARALESGPQAEGGSEPTVIAHHYSRAGEAEKSFQFWLRAADRSGERLAFAESAAALGFALAEAERIADPALRLRLKLEAQLKLGATLVFQKGPQSDEAEAALTEAYRLAKEAGAGAQLFQAVWGLYLSAGRNRQLDKARLRGEELLAISDALGDGDLKFEALHHRWGFAYFMGETAKMIDYSERGLKRYDAARHHRFSYTYAGHDPGVCAYCVKALGLGVAGQASNVKPALDASLELAETLQHPMTTAFAQSIGCHALYFARDPDACQAYAERLIELSTRYDLPINKAIGTFWIGAADVMRGDTVAGLRRMAPAFEPTYGWRFLSVLPGVVMAEALARAGRSRDALEIVARMLGEVQDPETGVFISELWRIRGELAVRERGGDASQAQRDLQTALRIATAQKATLLQSRAAISLARHLAERDKRQEAKAALAVSGVSALADRAAPEIAAAQRLAAELG